MRKSSILHIGADFDGCGVDKITIGLAFASGSVEIAVLAREIAKSACTVGEGGAMLL